MKADVITIRIAEPADAERVSSVLAASYRTVYADWYPADVLAAAMPALAAARNELLTSKRFYIAETLAGPIACGGWSLERPGATQRESGLAHVRQFATEPNHLRRGVGGAILEYSIRQARAAGCVEMECDSSLPAERFYASYGFERRGEREILIGGKHRFPVVRMTRPL